MTALYESISSYAGFVRDIVIILKTLRSTSEVPSKESICVSLARVLPALAYMSMLFILQLSRTAAGRINNMNI